jgi:pimeloyl-ACP methyl ester carboxylesterase
MLGAQDSSVSGVISLAGISNIEKRFPTGELLEEWEKAKVKYVHNSRTGQDLPQYFVQYEDFKSHEDELSIQKVSEQLKKPVLLIHGDKDSSVSIDEGFELAGFCRTDLKVIAGADHTFGSKHPWNETEMPPYLSEVCSEMEHFLIDL